MKFNRFLAMLCALVLLLSSMTAALPAFADEEPAAEEPAPAPDPAPAPAPDPAPAPATNPDPAPATNPDPAPATNPDPAPATNPDPAPATNPDPAPASDPEPAEETPADLPSEAPETEKPTEAPTEAPTLAPTEEPTPAPTEEPTPEPTEEPTPTPLPPVKLYDLKADKQEIALGKAIHFTFIAENAETVEWSAGRSDGLDGGSGSCAGGAFDWTPGQSGIYTVEVTAVGGDMTTVSQKCQVTVRDGKLTVKVKPTWKWARVGDLDLMYELTVIGGVEPYSASIEIEYKNKKFYTSNVLESKVQVGAEGYGDHKLTLKVTDATGAVAQDDAVIKASDDKKDDAPSLPRLRKDMTFAERVVAVAWSQVGYEESEHNFIIRDDKTRQGWSFYGQWAGMPFEEWCAMFASYCLEMAGVPRWMMPQEANCNRWKNKLGKRYIDDEDEYIPEPGDLIFFRHDRVSKDPNFPNHVGIVVDYDPEKDLVYTVEGNAGAAVRNRVYARGNSVIVGYASIGYCMKRWDKVYLQRLRDQLASDRAERAERYNLKSKKVSKGTH